MGTGIDTGWILVKRVQDPCMGFRGIVTQKSFKIDVPGNGISSFLRPSQQVVMFDFFKFTIDIFLICPRGIDNVI